MAGRLTMHCGSGDRSPVRRGSAPAPIFSKWGNRRGQLLVLKDWLRDNDLETCGQEGFSLDVAGVR
jgi:hypothetical protein